MASSRGAGTYQLIYLSVRRIVEPGTIFGQDLRNILRTARSFNRSVGIGGALLFNGTCFAQVLEGDYDEVQALMRRIELDDRHANVTIVEERWVARRDFPHWAMAFADDTTYGALPVPPEFDPRQLAELAPPSKIIAAMRYLLAGDPDPDGVV